MAYMRASFADRWWRNVLMSAGLEQASQAKLWWAAGEQKANPAGIRGQESGKVDYRNLKSRSRCLRVPSLPAVGVQWWNGTRSWTGAESAVDYFFDLEGSDDCCRLNIKLTSLAQKLTLMQMSILAASLRRHSGVERSREMAMSASQAHYFAILR